MVFLVNKDKRVSSGSIGQQLTVAGMVEAMDCMGRHKEGGLLSLTCAKCWHARRARMQARTWIGLVE
jgi:hypothetical protein